VGRIYPAHKAVQCPRLSESHNSKQPRSIFYRLGLLRTRGLHGVTSTTSLKLKLRYFDLFFVVENLYSNIPTCWLVKSQDVVDLLQALERTLVVQLAFDLSNNKSRCSFSFRQTRRLARQRQYHHQRHRQTDRHTQTSVSTQAFYTDSMISSCQ